MESSKTAAASAIDAFLRALGRDPSTEPELQGTPERVAEAFFEDLCAGYGVDAEGLVVANRLRAHTELVVVRDLAVTTVCPHHLLPAHGMATVALAPSEWAVGVGTLGRLVDTFSRRLALQEEIGEQVVSVLERVLSPRWVGCRLVLTHGCMVARGERKHGARVETLALRGVPQGAERAAIFQALGVGA